MTGNNHIRAHAAQRAALCANLIKRLVPPLMLFSIVLVPLIVGQTIGPDSDLAWKLPLAGMVSSAILGITLCSLARCPQCKQSWAPQNPRRNPIGVTQTGICPGCGLKFEVRKQGTEATTIKSEVSTESHSNGDS